MWSESLSPERPAKRAFWKGFEDDDDTSDDGRDGSAEGGQRSKRHTPEQIVAKMRDADATLNAGKDIAAVVDLQQKFATSERRACGVLGIPRSTQRSVVQPRTDEVAICQRLRAKVRQRPRFGDRRSTQLLKREGWTVNSKRIHRLCRSDNGPEFISKAIRAWLERLGIEVLHIAPGSP